MLKRAFSTTNHHHQYHQGTPRWKVRLCYGFLILIFITFAIILIAWNMLCALPNTNPLLVSEGEANNQLILNESASGSAVTPHTVKRYHVEIFYEVLCPDSRYFILKELIPAYNLLKDYIKPAFIPFGKATTKSTEGRWTFDCQHGETECSGNMIHACAIGQLTSKSDEPLLVAYIGCMINNNRNPEDIGKKCAKELGVDWGPIEKCWKGTVGPELLKSHGEQTHSLRPAVSFIPTVVINGNQKGQKDILKAFKSFLCQNTLTKENPKQCQDGLGKWRFNA